MYDFAARFPSRATLWRPGLTHNGGFPHAAWPIRTTLAWATGDQTSRIQSEINAAHSANPSGVICVLGAGTWSLNAGAINIPSFTVLRGSGVGSTILTASNGANDNTYIPPSRGTVPMVNIGTGAGQGTSQNLSANGVKGSYSVTVTSATGLSAGQYVLLDELSGAAWQTDPQGLGQIWASSDFGVVWQRHNPSLPVTDDPYPAAWAWYCRNDRPQSEIKKISTVAGTTITFDSPLHKDYRTAQTAQLTPYSGMVTYSGIEDLSMSRGSNGNLRFTGAAYCWAKNIEASKWLNENVCIGSSFRIELVDSYLHDACWPEPGGGGYAVSLEWGSSECLVQNNISIWTCKNIVARSSGSGSVVAYNYMDVAFDSGNPAWQEVHLNGSHMVGPHHILFEGNYAPNWDSDKTHGNATYHTAFRNWLTGIRKTFTTYAGVTRNDSTAAVSAGGLRCSGPSAFGYYHSLIGNVLGRSGQMSGWVYEDTTNKWMVNGSGFTRAIYTMGWDDWLSAYPTVLADPAVSAPGAKALARDGNFDFVTNTQKWHGAGGVDTPANADTLPDSLYLSAKPAFFGALQWPWVDPAGATKLYTLPAKARYDALISGVSTMVVSVAAGGQVQDLKKIAFTAAGGSIQDIRKLLATSAGGQVAVVFVDPTTPGYATAVTFPFTASGTSTPNAVVTAYNNVTGAVLGTTTAAGDGTWTMSITSVG